MSSVFTNCQWRKFPPTLRFLKFSETFCKGLFSGEIQISAPQLHGMFKDFMAADDSYCGKIMYKFHPCWWKKKPRKREEKLSAERKNGNMVAITLWKQHTKELINS